jgi:soluble lytic murein transglycosylase-like protein
MKLIMEELRAVKKSQAEALARWRTYAGNCRRWQRRPHRRQLSAATEWNCRQSVPVGRRDVWEHLDQEFLLHRRPGQIMLWLKRMGKFMPLIEQRLKEYGLPDDLKYLAVVESSLPDGECLRRRRRLWQFIEGTGRRFDMDSNALVDERMDVAKATDGAMQYLRRLYALFNDWPLALAGYNAGEQRVLDDSRSNGQQLLRSGAAGETERFVYKIIAVKIILANPERYGIYIDARNIIDRRRSTSSPCASAAVACTCGVWRTQRALISP